jgi:hypothetical protein
MSNESHAQTFGLSQPQARLLRAIFQLLESPARAGHSAQYTRAQLQSQLRTGELARNLAQLRRAGLLAQGYQLTFAGLAVAVNLPALPAIRPAVLAA